MTETCETCRFWHDLKREESDGECRKHAPQPGQFDGWPLTKQGYWCGEHERPFHRPPQNFSHSAKSLRLGVRARKALHVLGISTIEELSNLHEDQLRQVKNVGTTTIQEIKNRLADRGMSLAEHE